MSFFSFVAGFFRDSGATESSTRLVGILSFGMAAFLSAYTVMADKVGLDTGSIIAMNFTYGCVALGLRKAPEDIPNLTP